MGGWVSPRIRDEVVDFVSHYSLLTGLALSRLVGWVGIGRDKFYGWRQRYGLGNDHNALVPRDFWLEEWEKRAIIAYRDEHPAEGVSAPDLHDARRECRRGEPLLDLSRAQGSRRDAKMER
jgi:hypothetical protein